MNIYIYNMYIICIYTPQAGRQAPEGAGEVRQQRMLHYVHTVCVRVYVRDDDDMYTPERLRVCAG